MKDAENWFIKLEQFFKKLINHSAAWQRLLIVFYQQLGAAAFW